MNYRNRKNWILALALCLPVAVFIAGYVFNHVPGLIPTGFIQYDNVAYVAYAKQYVDASEFHVGYPNPFSFGGDQIYFQPQTIFFASLLKIGIPPGWILIPFTLICSVICFRLIIAIYDHLMPFTKFRIWNIWLLSWGGGLLVLAGFLAHLYLSRPGSVFHDLFIVDPEGGWWGLNLGRSLFFSCEAYYHALFLGCVLCLMKKKWITGLLLLFLLSLSHPFTGIELAAIVCFWCFIELLIRKKEVPLWFMVGSLLVLIFHLYYYLVYLNQFPDHRSVSDQYSLNWRLRFYRMIPAYCLVGSLAIVTFTKIPIRNFFSFKTNRLFCCWFIVAFILANHEMFTPPKQPIHFTRGYIWTSLFLLGLPALHQLNEYIKRKWKIIGFILLGMIFFTDNFLWIVTRSIPTVHHSYPTYITAEQQDILQLLNKESSNETIIVTQDMTLSYLSSVYTKAIPWYSHPYTTPYAAIKKNALDQFFINGKLDTAWKGRDVSFLLNKRDTVALHVLNALTPEKMMTTRTYILYVYRPLH